MEDHLAVQSLIRAYQVSGWEGTGCDVGLVLGCGQVLREGNALSSDGISSENLSLSPLSDGSHSCCYLSHYQVTYHPLALLVPTDLFVCGLSMECYLSHTPWCPK